MITARPIRTTAAINATQPPSSKDEANPLIPKRSSEIRTSSYGANNEEKKADIEAHIPSAAGSVVAHGDRRAQQSRTRLSTAVVLSGLACCLAGDVSAAVYYSEPGHNYIFDDQFGVFNGVGLVMIFAGLLLRHLENRNQSVIHP